MDLLKLTKPDLLKRLNKEQIKEAQILPANDKTLDQIKKDYQYIILVK